MYFVQIVIPPHPASNLLSCQPLLILFHDQVIFFRESTDTLVHDIPVVVTVCRILLLKQPITISVVLFFSLLFALFYYSLNNLRVFRKSFTK